MERKKNKIEIPDLEIEILGLCLFEEAFDTLVSEVKLETKVAVIADAIKNLIHLKFIKPSNLQNSLSWIYDSDKMMESKFQATARGIQWLEQHKN